MMVYGGSGKGKGAISDMVINACVDGNLNIKINGIEYSTNPREIVTVEMMIEHSIRRGDFME